jgi:hypothetical protein
MGLLLVSYKILEKDKKENVGAQILFTKEKVHVWNSGPQWSDYEEIQ